MGERGGAIDWTAPGTLPDALFELELEDLPKVGARKAERLRMYGIESVSDFFHASLSRIRDAFGSVDGERILLAMHGHDVRWTTRKAPKSMSHSRVLERSMRKKAEPIARWLALCGWLRARGTGLRPGKIRLEAKVGDRLYAALCAIPYPGGEKEALGATSAAWRATRERCLPERITVILDDLARDPWQFVDLLEGADTFERPIDRAFAELRERYGVRAIQRGVTGDPKIDSTTCATSPTTKTAAGCEPATCRAISPASRTSPSPSFASRGASTPSPKPTGTTLGGPRTPCASSSTRPNAEPHATATPRRLAPPPRQRSRSPGRAIRASGLLCIPLQTTQIPSSVTSPSSHSTGYRTTTTDSNQSRAHPCTEQNFTLAESQARALFNRQFDYWPSAEAFPFSLGVKAPSQGMRASVSQHWADFRAESNLAKRRAKQGEAVSLPQAAVGSEGSSSFHGPDASGAQDGRVEINVEGQFNGADLERVDSRVSNPAEADADSDDDYPYGERPSYYPEMDVSSLAW